MPEAVRYQHVTTIGVQAPERFDYWRTWYLGAAGRVGLEPLAAVPADFRSSASLLTVGAVSIVEVQSGPSRSTWPRELTEVRDTLAIVLFGPAPGMRGRWHGHDLLLDRAAVLCGRTAGGWCAPAGLRMIQVNLPRAMLPVAGAVVDRIAARQALSSSPVFTSLVRPALAGMAGHLDELAGSATADLATMWLSLGTMLLRSLDGHGTDGAECAAARRLAAEQFITAHLADPRLRPSMVAEALHVSRRSLYALFAEEGEGVAGAIRRRRLERARGLLLDPRQRHRPVAAIAAAVGLPSPGHFSRLFRAEYGQTPRDLRPAAPATAS